MQQEASSAVVVDEKKILRPFDSMPQGVAHIIMSRDVTGMLIYSLVIFAWGASVFATAQGVFLNLL